jgi:hypothetical protein
MPLPDFDDVHVSDDDDDDVGDAGAGGTAAPRTVASHPLATATVAKLACAVPVPAVDTRATVERLTAEVEALAARSEGS